MSPPIFKSLNPLGLPKALQLEFGHERAFDIDRTYGLENAGYHVRWSTIPAVITPMNRILMGMRRL